MREKEWMPRIDSEICIGCRACIETCPTSALEQLNGKAALAYPKRCIYCLACEDVCPVNAIELPFVITIRTKEQKNVS